MGWYPGWWKTAGLPHTYGGSATTAAVLHGSGTSGSPTATATAGKNFLGYWVKSTATSGDARGLYLRLYLSAAGSGEAVRAYTTADAANVATGGTANGIHASLSIAAAGSISGAGNAGRFTIDAAAASRTLSGTLAAIQVDSNFGAGNTLPATAAFIRVTDTGSVLLGNLLNVPAPSNSTIFATHTTQAMTHSLRIVAADGTPYYVMVTNAATNRGGGS